MGILYRALVALLAMGISYPITSASTSFQTCLNLFEVKPLENDSLRETFTATADAMTSHSGYQFSTEDSDNDDSTEINCGAEYRSGWWYKSCHYSNLNGEYVHAGEKPRLEYSGIAGNTWLKNYGHLQLAEMKIRPVGKS